MLKSLLREAFNRLGLDVQRYPRPPKQPQELHIPDEKYYRPLFSPWLGYGDFSKYYDLAKSRTLVSPDRCWILYSLCRQALHLDGDVWECGVYQGGTAAMLAQIVCEGPPDKRLHLFDTFEGMPETDRVADLHQKGDFSDTSVEAVMSYVKQPAISVYHRGFIPDTFRELKKSKIAFAHIDVDIRQSVLDCCEFIYPRLSVGGFLVFDDYGFPSCPGARKAVDEFFSDTKVIPLALPTGQAVIFKSS